MRCKHLYVTALFLFNSTFLGAQNTYSFSGLWRQDIPESSPKTKARVPKQLDIKLEGDTLKVIMSGPGKVHQVNVTYQVGGPEVTYKGLDADEFHIKVSRGGDALVFEGREIEDGSEHPVHETWTLQQKREGQVLIDMKSTKDPTEPSQTKTEYERVKE